MMSAFRHATGGLSRPSCSAASARPPPSCAPRTSPQKQPPHKPQRKTQNQKKKKTPTHQPPEKAPPPHSHRRPLRALERCGSTSTELRGGFPRSTLQCGGLAPASDLNTGLLGRLLAPAVRSMLDTMVSLSEPWSGVRGPPFDKRRLAEESWSRAAVRLSRTLRHPEAPATSVAGRRDVSAESVGGEERDDLGQSSSFPMRCPGGMYFVPLSACSRSVRRLRMLWRRALLRMGLPPSSAGPHALTRTAERPTSDASLTSSMPTPRTVVAGIGLNRRGGPRRRARTPGSPPRPRCAHHARPTAR